jgi:hypothetical protein
MGKVFICKFVEIGPSSYEKIIYRAAVSQRLRNTGLDNLAMNLEMLLLFKKAKRSAACKRLAFLST